MPRFYQSMEERR